MDRAAYLSALIGRPYDRETANCWHLAQALQRDLFGRQLPDASPEMVENLGARARALASHRERSRWRATQVPEDGALALMGRVADRETHVGVVLVEYGQPMIWHSDDPHGVVADYPTELEQARRWRITYLVPA